MKVSEISIRRGRAAAYLLTMLICAFPALFINTFYGYVPFLAMLAVLAVSVLYVLLIRNALYAEGIAETVSCRRGETVPLAVTVGNRSVFPVPAASVTFFRASEYFDREELEESSLSILPKRERTFRFDILFDHIGMYRAGVRSLTVTDFLGIVEVVYLTDAVMQVCVSPNRSRQFSRAKAEPAPAESQKATVSSFRESMDYAGVREYHFGDPIKNIHWKLSAHSREYVTKQHEAYTNPGTTVITDFRFREQDPDRIMDLADAVAEAGVSAAYDCFSLGIDYEILYKGLRGGYQKFVPADFRLFSQWVANIPISAFRPEEEKEKLQWVQSLKTAYTYSNIIFCTADSGSDLINSLISLKQSGKQAAVLFMIPEDAFGEDYTSRIAPLKKLDSAQVNYRILRTGSAAADHKAGGWPSDMRTGSAAAEAVDRGESPEEGRPA